MRNHRKCNASNTKTLFFRVQGLQNRTPNRSKIGSKSHLRRGGLQKASGEPLGALLEASGAGKKEVGNGSWPAWAPKGVPKLVPRCDPKTPQDALRSPRGSKSLPGNHISSVLEPFAPPSSPSLRGRFGRACADEISHCNEQDALDGLTRI